LLINTVGAHMTTQPDDKPKKTGKLRLMPIPGKRQSFKKALESINKQFGGTLARLADYEAYEKSQRS